MNFVPSKTPANSGFSKFQIEYFYVFSPAFLPKIFLNDFWAVKIGLKYTRRVVREVEGAALEIFFAKRKPDFRKAFNRAGFGHSPVANTP